MPRGKIEQAARVLAIAACVWFGLVAAWGMFGQIGAGHYAAMLGIAICAENIVHWHVAGPVWDYLTSAPTPAQYYCHHPFGPFWATAIPVALFGHHDFVAPLPAVLMSAATAVLLYKTAREAWGWVAGAAAAVGFVLIPITVGFANFHNLEVMVIFGWALFFWGQTRLISTWKVRHLLASAAGAAVAAMGDWIGNIAIGIVLGWALLRVLFPRSRTATIADRRYAQWWALVAVVCVAIFGYFVAVFADAGKLQDWIGSAQSRGGGGFATLDAALKGKAFWIELMFLPPIIFLGKLALPVVVVRAVVFRKDAEIFSLAALAAATVQYVEFREGADIHIFWPHYFAAYFALAFAQLVATIVGVVGWFARLSGATSRDWIGKATGLLAVALFAVLFLPDAVRTLRYARLTQGRYNEKGAFVRSDADIVCVLRAIRSRVPWGSTVLWHTGVYWGWQHTWAVHAHPEETGTIPTRSSPRGSARIFVARASGLSGKDQKELVSNFHTEIYGDVWIVDRSAPPGPLQAYGFDEREPNPLEWYFLSGVEPVRHIRPDPFATWEWQTHLDQPATVPHEEPRTLEEIRIAHNIAVSQGDATAASALKKRIEGSLTSQVVAEYTQKISLIGVRVVDGVLPRLEVWFEAGGPTDADANFDVRANMIGPRRFSFVPVDPVERDVGILQPMATTLYKPGFIYMNSYPLHQRIGSERVWGIWRSRGSGTPPELPQNAPTKLLTLD